MISHRQYITHGAVTDNSCAGSWWAYSPRFNFSACSVPHSPLTPSLMSSMTFSLWKAISIPLLVSFHPTLCLFLLTSVTHSSKWAWHASHCLTKVCVCGRCLGRWDLLWDTLISSKPKPRQGGAGQVSGTTHNTPWLLLSVRVKSAPSFMAQSLLHPGIPNHLASIPGRWSLPRGLWGRKQRAAALPREPPERAFCHPRVC